MNLLEVKNFPCIPHHLVEPLSWRTQAFFELLNLLLLVLRPYVGLNILDYRRYIIRSAKLHMIGTHRLVQQHIWIQAMFFVEPTYLLDYPLDTGDSASLS